MIALPPPFWFAIFRLPYCAIIVLEYAMPVYRDDAVVLRTHQLGEADRIITMLTREHGKIRAVGKGVRRTKSRIGARLEPFMYIDVQCYEGRSLDNVTQVETIAALAGPISADYELYTTGSAMLEIADRLVPEEKEPAITQFWLLVGGLTALAARRNAPGLVLDSYLLRAFAVAGWALSAFDCARCGEPGPHAAFSIPLGGSVCGHCRPPGALAPAPDTVELLGALLSGDWVTADASTARARRAAGGIVAAYSQHYLERDLRTLKHIRAGENLNSTVATNWRNNAPLERVASGARPEPEHSERFDRIEQECDSGKMC